jgi:hypothetical protein
LVKSTEPQPSHRVKCCNFDMRASSDYAKGAALSGIRSVYASSRGATSFRTCCHVVDLVVPNLEKDSQLPRSTLDLPQPGRVRADFAGF